jgi:N-acetylmuramoyl-L-alanine amidase
VGEGASGAWPARSPVGRMRLWRVFVHALSGYVLLCIGLSARPVEQVCASPEPPRVVAIRHFASEAHTRVVVELSRAVEPGVRAVPTPDEGPARRLYLDLPGASIDSGIAKSIDLPVGPLSGLRVGKRDLDTVRLALSVRNAEAYEVFRLAGPARVVLDVRAAPNGGRGQTDAHRPQRSRPASPSAERPAPLPAPETTPSKSKAAEPIGPMKIVIDPGHGGKDPGAQGVKGALEKDVVLAISRQVAPRLRQELGAAVVLTRDRDVYLSLEERTARANAERADLFISIHANASTSPKLSGVETYYLNNTNDRAAIRLAAMENGLTLIGDVQHRRGVDLSYILSDMVQQGKIGDSIVLAQALHRGLVGRLTKQHADVVDLGVKKGPFYVLVGAYMPCALVEVAFLTNPIEGKRLQQDAYQAAVADGIVAGVRRYLASLRRAQTL